MAGPLAGLGEKRLELLANHGVQQGLLRLVAAVAVKWPAGRTDKARNEPRDLYDLWYLTSAGLVDLATLIPEIETKLASRGRTREAMPGELASKEARCKKLWSVRLGQQMTTLPPFEDVFRAMRRSLRDARLIER